MELLSTILPHTRMSHMEVAFFEAECTEGCTVPTLGKCKVGQVYRLNFWQARAFFGCFNIKDAKVSKIDVVMDDKDQAEVQTAIDRKLEEQDKFIDLLKNGPPKRTTQKPVPRPDVVKAMAAGKINDLLVSYGLPKLNHKEKNIELVLAYEDAIATTKELSQEERAAALKELKVEIPTEGDFDAPAALAKAMVMANVDEADIVSKKKPGDEKADKKTK